MTAAPAATAPAAPLSFTVDPWDPGYGQAFSDEQDEPGGLSASSAVLDASFEIPAADWRPIDPDPAAPIPPRILFLDGVRRIDARIWVHGGGLQPVAGVAASLAVGLVVCEGVAKPPTGAARPLNGVAQAPAGVTRPANGVTHVVTRAAHVADVVVERGLFTAAGDVGALVTRAGRYEARAAEGAGLDKLSLALQQRLSFAEVALAVAVRAAHPGDDDLLIVDGPLRGRAHLDRTVGYIKTHHASYLPSEQAAVVGALRPGQRTPAFTMGTSWQRTSWYLQLPGTDGVPWSGVVRLECSADLAVGDVTRLADLTALILPSLASVPHKDPRAPQNLVPIGGLERQLKHRLGDERLLYRALRAAALALLAAA
ncbi:MAG TPA: hypothetical protein VMR14_19980 [Streptosporangiaceae bacterium]|nr:hypothetical protein [Streptosporangiaceae bacterium]